MAYSPIGWHALAERRVEVNLFIHGTTATTAIEMGGAFVGSDWENMAVEVVVDKPGIGPRGWSDLVGNRQGEPAWCDNL